MVLNGAMGTNSNDCVEAGKGGNCLPIHMEIASNPTPSKREVEYPTKGSVSRLAPVVRSTFNNSQEKIMPLMTNVKREIRPMRSVRWPASRGITLNRVP